MTLAPEMATSPLQQAPADRATVSVEDWARQGLALLFADGGLDQNEMRVVRNLFQQIAARAQQGGIGQGGTPQAAGPEGVGQGSPPSSPQDMNQNVEDFGTVAGSSPQDMGGY